MKNKSKIIAGGIVITGMIGATSFAIMDPYNILSNKNVDLQKNILNTIETDNKDKEDIDNKKDEKDISLSGIKDGTYLGVSKGYGGDIKVKVTIESGKIKSIEVVSHSETPKYYENGSKVIASILKENSTNVDAISGATLTSNGIKNAVRDALSKAGFNIEANNKEVSVSKNSSKTSNLKSNNTSQNVKSVDLKEYKLKDGEYIGEAIGFKGNVKVKVIISDGKLSDVKVISHNDDAEFFNKAKGVIIKIVKNQGTAGVDTVSGATYSSRGILNAVNSALNKVAKENKGIINTIKIAENNSVSKGNNTTQINIKDIIKDTLKQSSIRIDENKNSNKNLGEHKFKDGEYIGEAKGFKGNVKVKVIIKNGTLVNVEIINHNDDDEFFNNAKRLIFKILKNQGTTGVDTVSGATYSSRGILNSVNEALNKAIKKDTSISSNTSTISKNINILENNKPKETLDNKKNEITKNQKENLEKHENNDRENNLNDKDIKYLDGEYIGVGTGFTNGHIKSKVIFENNKIKSIEVATKESGDYDDDGVPFRDMAIKVVDHILEGNGKKVIEDLILHKKIVDEIFNSDNYYEKGKELIGNYAEELKKIDKNKGNRFIREDISSSVKKYMKVKNNATVLDSVSGATFSAIGIAKSVKDAMDKSANDFESGNIINNLKIKTPSEKSMFVDFKYSDKEKKLDLSDLKVTLVTRDGKEKEISYDKFKENDIEIYDRETGKAITNGMDLSSYRSKSGQGIYAIIKHKKSLYTDTLIIIPSFFDTNYLTGIEYSIDNGISWNAFPNLVISSSNNINFYQTVKVPKEYKGKDILLRLVSTNKSTYLLEPVKSGEVLKVEKERYSLKTSEKDELRNYNIRGMFNIGFEFIENSDDKEELNKDSKYLNGKYIGVGTGWTGKPIKSEVVFENNKIKSINVATKESGDYGDDDEPFRDKAVKVVDLLKNDTEKTINDLLISEKIGDEIYKSSNYYEKGKELIGDYAEKLKSINKDTSDARKKIYEVVRDYLKEQKNAIVFDVVSGATYSARGIAKSVKDAMDKSANDYKTGNIISSLKIKAPNSKKIEINKKEKLNLSDLKVTLSMRDGKENEISYDKFEENGIEIYEKNTRKTIYHGMDLNDYETNHNIDVVIEHKKSLYKDTLTIVPIMINNNYIIGMEYSIDNGITWNKVTDLKKFNNDNNIHHSQEVKISDIDKKKTLIRLVSLNGDKYQLELKDIVEGPNGYYYFESKRDDQIKNKNISSAFFINFKSIESSENNINDSLEKLSYARIYLNDSTIYEKYSGRIKVGQKIDWAGTKFQFKTKDQGVIKDLFTEDEIKKIKNVEYFKKTGFIDYEDLEKLGITISLKQDAEVTEDMIPKDKSWTEPIITLTYKGKVLKVKGGSITGDVDDIGMYLVR
ncbi:FMN-binding protein [Clostridium perfringens]|uniref:FMN-binding protein n=1 Tax=Clostridium perfringens TaxID=1502 RepID=UPI0013E3A9A1|nr:FMN-binding protein [Clostridium perfringens]EJT5933858.1 FMN-binding protein [Clostridium perfringens]MDG6893377.1 Na(+)-translocating NADH-quinone reductase subunit C [Clostridium perfringens]MDH2339521.1 FMN-binding protein [Clostridium perfringens]NGT59372.1 FMN-binding protein [Clostridium perfringens]HDI3015557.1 FMN-binding protein [Clostridium perfringens]